MNVKKKCALASLEYIEDHTIIGLGGGSTIGYLIDYIIENERKVKVVTPSLQTKLLCVSKGLEVLPTCSVDEIEVAFDGCDEVDEQLNALKSGGGIHTLEKLTAQMAKEYILLADESKFVQALTYKHPVVLEILPDSLALVLKKLKAFEGNAIVRTSKAKDGYTITDQGNFLIDVYFEPGQDSSQLEEKLRRLAGVIDVSLFTSVVTKVLVASESGVVVKSK